MADQPRYRRLKALKVALLLLMGGLMLIQGLQLSYEFVSLNHILQIKNGTQVPLPEVIANERKKFGTEFDFAALSIPTAIVFLAVLFRLRRNVEAVGVRDLPISTGWTVGYFFVPILNLFRPFQAVRDMWKASQPDTNGWQVNPVFPTVHIWWSLWITTGFLNYALLFSFFVVAADTFEKALMVSVLTILVSFMTFALIVTATAMLVRLMQLQDEKYRRLGGQIDAHLTCSACGETSPRPDNQGRCPLCGADPIPI